MRSPSGRKPWGGLVPPQAERGRSSRRAERGRATGLRLLLLGVLVGPIGARRAAAQEAPDAGAMERIPSGSAVDPGARSPLLKRLSPEQRLPENLQSWLRERRRISAGPDAKPPPIAVPVPSPPTLTPEPADGPRADEPRRPLRSFEQRGVTVLSNRELARATVPNEVAARVPSTPPRPPPAPEPGDAEEAAVPAPEHTQTHSLKAFGSEATRHASEGSSPTWPVFAAVTGGLGLVALWARRRGGR